jgi:heat-inducible transcriptional repressor
MEIELSSREKLLLKYIIEEYIKSITPVGSEILKKNHLNDISSATIRNDLYNLEKKGFIEKTHTSSGRIPSIKGYKYYDENILKPKMDNELKLKLQKVFLQRNLSIESIMNQTTDIINNVLKLPSV